ncbi:MAG: recombinase family protein [Roseateles sp.]|uniref:recombinase family protein n=1 Tax=Roseateles sp. TaxID=1971397 RepID=UPI0039ECD902
MAPFLPRSRKPGAANIAAPIGRTALKLGYARVSTLEQDTRLQIDALKKAGVSKYWHEKRSGVKERPELEDLLSSIGTGDVVVVYKIDRLARSLQDLIRIESLIRQAGACLQSLTEPIETQTAVGRMMFQLLGAFAEFERSLINERCTAGRIAARARGVRCTKPRKFDYESALRMRNSGASITQIAEAHGVSFESVKCAIYRMKRGKTPVAMP